MKRIRFPSTVRAAAAALALVLSACEGDGIVVPPDLAGSWLETEQFGSGEQAIAAEERLELEADGRFSWTTIHVGAGGRPQDALRMWSSRYGDWRVRERGMELRTASGLQWLHGRGWSQDDYVPEWSLPYTLELDGDRLVLTEPVFPYSFAPPRTYVFRRVPGHDGAPKP